MRFVALMPDSSEAALSAGAPTSLVDLVAECSGISSAVLDEHYTLTATVAQRRRADSTAQTVVVKFIDHGPKAGELRWTAAAHDELRELATPTTSAPTAQHAVTRLDWKRLDR
jgi:hypothetical protein